MTQRKKKPQKQKKFAKIKYCKRKVWGGLYIHIYIDGLSEYVSNGCEDDVVLNIVITF